MSAKAEQKLAKQQAQEDLLKQIRRDTLEREAELDKKTWQKIKDKWFESIVETKIPQMQDNLKHIFHYMEKLIEAESYRKSLFEEERQELEETDDLLAQSHTSALDNLFDIFEKRIKDMSDAYDQVVSTRTAEAEEEFTGMKQREAKTQENLQTMLYQIQEYRQNQEEKMNCNMFLRLDEERSKKTEVHEALRAKLERKMEKRWGEITATLKKYEETTKTRRKDYSQLKIKDDADSRIIHQQIKKTEKLFAQVDELKRCIEECYAPKEVISYIRDLREERARFLSSFKELKKIVGAELKEDKNNLKALTYATNILTKNLRKICKKGEQILTIYRICLRLETQMEKVFPVGEYPKTLAVTEPRKKVKMKLEQDKTPKDQLQRPKFNNSVKAIKDLMVLQKFWQKMGQARISKLALTKCIQNLKAENKILKQMLAMYLKEYANKDLKTFSVPNII